MSDIRRGTANRSPWRARVTLAALAVVSAAVAAVLAEAPAPGTTEATSEMSAPQGLRTVVIDPGHGGSAIGAQSGNVFEKDIALDVAMRLRDLILRRMGLQVVLTRDADVDVPLDERTEKANYWKADLFVSIHANAYRAGEIRGPETYFLSDRASDARSRAVAESENGPASSTDDPELDPSRDPSLQFILWDLAQAAHLRESSVLAEMIQSGLNDLWEIGDRGVKQAPFRVLKGATMPAVLVEIGYLSNPSDADRLLDPAFRERLAESLYGSISLFRERYAALIGAPPGS